MKHPIPPINISGLLLYTRQGYASQAGLEITQYCEKLGLYGYVECTKNDAQVAFYLYSPVLLADLQQVRFSELVFARQLVFLFDKLVRCVQEDRVTELLDVIPEALGLCQTAVVETPDTESGKALAKFSRKFSVPWRQGLRDKEYLFNRKFKQPITGMTIHVLLQDANTAYVGLSIPNNRSTDMGGIKRLKFPNDAPSRSTLKLEEALLTLMTSQEREAHIREGQRAVDLGACPGGWTYQLVQRGMHVEAIDNGDIAPSLMATGQVEHFAVDGFTYRPKYKQVDWLVCDMIEQPQRVNQLMLKWVLEKRTQHALFNLKLPMKQRHAMVQQCLHDIDEQLAQANINAMVRAKHLYHNRDEITVLILQND